MGKVASKYLKTRPFSIAEEGWHPEKNRVSESLFSLGNEYQGIRGFFDEGVSADSLQGVYFNGIYEYAREETKNAYKGIIKRPHFMINSVNWVKTRIVVDETVLDLGKASIEAFERELDFRSGLLKRSFVWNVGEKKIRLTFFRFLSMTHCKRAFQKIEIESDRPCSLHLELTLDSDVLHWGDHCYYDRVEENRIGDVFYLEVQTPTTKQKVVSAMKIEGLGEDYRVVSGDKTIAVALDTELKPNEKKAWTRFVVNTVDKTGSKAFSVLREETLKEVSASCAEGFEGNLNRQKAYWKAFFDEHDVEIRGDDENQQGIRFCLFQLQQTYHGYDASNNIGAKGLTGEAYSGHTFWDTETYCLSYYLLNDPDAAKKLLLYRYRTLKEAKARAKMLDCRGACYPIATLNGEESCALWQHASLQFQPSTGVAYAIEHYYRLTEDTEFLKEYGLEMLLEIASFLYSRGDYNPDKTGFGFYCVMGPDEFQMMVNHNTYTNYMAKRTFEFTLEAVRLLPESLVSETMEKVGVTKAFLEEIRLAAEKMILLYDASSGLFEQHEGFFKLPHIDVDRIPVSDFPLYDHWSYDRIYRNDMIKQPDVLMFLFLYNSSFDAREKAANYHYYEPRCIHESSLSPSIHSILASEIGEKEDALRFFGFATRLDLDDYNRNTSEGLHTTSISAAWMNIVYGFGGVRTDGKELKINPTIPSVWEGYSFSLRYRNSTLKVSVDRNGYEVRLVGGQPQRVCLGDRSTRIADVCRVDFHE